MTEAAYKYWAFISYSHDDIGWAEWLHRALESYAVPSRLIGRQTAAGVLPRRLFPVFRDRDELSSSAELGGVIHQALCQSRYLIVISSPNAARSRWVNEEVRTFKSLGREHQVLALIVAGEPGDAALECFPPALRHVVDAAGRIGETAVEPIAADARPGRDSRTEALTRLLAGLLDVPYDELRQRDRQRRYWQRLRVAAVLALLGLVGIAGWQAERDARAEAARIAQRERWVEAGRRHLLADRPASAARYLHQALLDGEETPALRLMLAQAMRSLDAQTAVRVHHGSEFDGSVAWLPDSDRFLTVWRDVRLWDAGTGALLRRYDSSEMTAKLVATVTDDGRHFAVSGQTAFSEQPRQVELFEIASGERRLQVAGRISSVYGPSHRSFSSARGELAIIDSAGAVRLYASGTGEPRWSPAATRASSAVFDAAGQLLLIAEADGWLSIWHLASRQRLLHFDSGLRQGLHAFFAGNDRLVLLDQRGKIRLHDRRSGRLIDAFGGHIGAIMSSAISADGRRLMTVAADGTKVWDMSNGDQLLHVTCDCPPAENHLDASGRWLAARFDRLRIGIWDLDSLRRIAVLEGHSRDINTVYFSPDGQRLLSGATDGDVVVWDRRPLRDSLQHRLPHDPPIAAGSDPETFGGQYSPDGQLMATAGGDGSARLWNADSGELLRVLRGHGKTVNHTAFSPDGQWLATGSDDLDARLWRVATGETMAVLGGHDRFVRRLLFSPDSQVLLTVAGTESGLWHVPDGRLIGRLRGHSAPAVNGQFSADGRRVLTHGLDGTVRVFDTADGHLLATLTGHAGVVPAAFFIDGDRRVASAGVDGSLRIWDAASGRELQRIDEPLAGSAGFRHASLSHDGRQLLLSASTGDLLLWRWQDGRRLRFAGHTIAAYASAFSRDDALAVSGSNDGSSRVWDVASGLPLATFRLSYDDSPTPRWSAVFDPAATRVLTTGVATPPQAEVWDLPRETRDAATIGAILRCKSPWRIDGDQLLAQPGDPAACAALNLAAP